VFGNNSCWVVPRAGSERERGICFATGPMECELCGLALDPDERNLFLSVQHPGEWHGTGLGVSVMEEHDLVDRAGRPFRQARRVPLGSNWPQAVPGQAPRPGVVMVQRTDGGALLA
jgi:hypothetical protein